MADDLHRMLKSYDFLKSALETHGSSMTPSDRARISRERDELFLELASHHSSNPRVTAAQIKMFISALAGMTSRSEDAELLKKACNDATDRLVMQFEQQSKDLRDRASLQSVMVDGRTDDRPDAVTRSLFDKMPDRIAIFDSDYRYLFTNKSNADFHSRDASTFVEQPSWTVIGAKCFEELSKPNLDAGLAGRASTHIARLDHKESSFIYLISYDPMTDTAGKVRSVLVRARDVSHLQVTPNVIWPAPDAR